VLTGNRLAFVPQNATNIELCLRLTNGKPALARWIGGGGSMFGYMQSARSIARRHGMRSAIVAARNGGLPKR